MPQAGGVYATLPGHRISVSEGECEKCGAPATCRLQGETDSFGAEWWTLCDECADKSSETSPSGECETCRGDSEKLVPSRCWEEGPGGPVYWVCPECRERDVQAAREAGEELEQYLAEREDREADEDDLYLLDEEPEDPWEGVFLGEQLHARVCWPDYRHARQLLPTLRVRLTQPFQDLPVGSRLLLRSNDYGNRHIRRRWRTALPGKRVIASDLELVEHEQPLTEGSELWALYLYPER